MPSFAATADAMLLKDALAKLEMDRTTFYRYCEDGKLTKFIHAGRVYVPRDSVDDYLAKLRSGAFLEQTRNARIARARSAE